MGSALNSTAKNEPLPIMHFLIFNVTAKIHKNIKVFAIIFIIFYIFSQVFFIFSMPQLKFNQVFTISMYFYILISLTCTTFLMDIDNLKKSQRKTCWRLDSVGLQVKHEIFKITKSQETLTLIAFLIFILVCIPYIITSKHMRRADYVATLMGKYLPELKLAYTIFDTIFRLSIIFPICFSWPLHFMYFSWHVQIQVFMLTKFVKDLGKRDVPLTHCGVIQNEYHQRCIWRNLRFIIQRHTEVLRYNRESMRDLRVSITSLLLGVSGTCLCVSAICMAIIEQQIQAGMMLPIFLIYLEMLGFSAQAYEDRFGAIYDLALKAPWYEWDVKNRNAYMLLVQKSAQVVPYQFFNTRVNRAFQLELLKATYSVVSVFINFYF